VETGTLNPSNPLNPFGWILRAGPNILMGMKQFLNDFCVCDAGKEVVADSVDRDCAVGWGGAAPVCGLRDLVGVVSLELNGLSIS